MNRITVKRIAKLGIVNFWRNRWLSIASILIMTMTMIIISLFTMMALGINKTTDKIKSKMDITVYFQDSATTEEISNLQQTIASRPDVSQVKYISKEEAFKIWEETQKNERVKEIARKMEQNPFPRSLAIKASDPENLSQIAEFLASAQYESIVHKISYEDNKTIIDRLISLTSFTNKVGWLFSGIFIIISIVVILNTIRLAIYSRKEEVEIMRLVGASNTFIRLPFVVEGTLYGISACLIAMLLLWIGYLALTPLIRQLGSSALFEAKIFFISHLFSIFILQFFIGVSVGIGASLFSIRKYLQI